MQEYHIYCHIPYCKKRCKYCYFTAKFKEKEVIDLGNLDRYIAALEYDILNTDIPEGKLQSIVFGGGTPSLLSDDQLGIIMNAIHKKVSPDAFKSLEYIAYEVSPDTASYSTLSSFRKHGFNRISIGVQSFDDLELKLLGRPYKKSMIVQAMEDIRKLNYDLVNIDLLIGTPGQTMESAVQSVRETIALRPEHISISLFYKSYPGGFEYVNSSLEQGYMLFTLEEKLQVYKQICELLKESGYLRVDNTVFSLPGHIFSYEKDSISGTRTVLAFGPGSSGYWQNTIRYTPPEIEKYIQKPESVCEEFSVETNAYATVWGHLNAYGYIVEEDILKNFNLSTEQLISQDESISKLVSNLKQYNCLEIKDGRYSLNRDKLDNAIVLMQHDKDERGYKLITASKERKEESK